jgi:hypothetical protein
MFSPALVVSHTVTKVGAAVGAEVLTVGLPVGAAVVMVGELVTGAAEVGALVVGEVVVGAAVVGEDVSRRHWVSDPGEPTSPSGQLHAEDPLVVWILALLQFEVQEPKAGTPQSVLDPQKSVQVVTFVTFQAVRFPLNEVASWNI